MKNLYVAQIIFLAATIVAITGCSSTEPEESYIQISNETNSLNAAYKPQHTTMYWVQRPFNFIYAPQRYESAAYYRDYSLAGITTYDKSLSEVINTYIGNWTTVTNIIQQTNDITFTNMMEVKNETMVADGITCTNFTFVTNVTSIGTIQMIGDSSISTNFASITNVTTIKNVAMLSNGLTGSSVGAVTNVGIGLLGATGYTLGGATNLIEIETSATATNAVTVTNITKILNLAMFDNSQRTAYGPECTNFVLMMNLVSTNSDVVTMAYATNNAECESKVGAVTNIQPVASGFNEDRFLAISNVIKTQRTTQRNNFIFKYMRIISRNYESYVSSITGSKASIDVGSDMIMLGGNAAAAVVPLADTKTIINVALAAFTGTKTSFDKNVFMNQSILLLASKMEQNRLQERNVIRQKMSLSIDDYTLAEAALDLEDLYQSGTLMNVLEGIAVSSPGTNVTQQSSAPTGSATKGGTSGSGSPANASTSNKTATQPQAATPATNSAPLDLSNLPL